MTAEVTESQTGRSATTPRRTASEGGNGSAAGGGTGGATPAGSTGRVLRAITRSTLRRNPASSVILVLFVALAAMLASAASALIVTATGATTALMNRAETPHFLQMHAGAVDAGRMAAFAGSNPRVDEYAVVPMLNVDGAAIRVGDATLATGMQGNSFVAQNTGFDFLLDTDNQVIAPEEGIAWLPLYYEELLGLEAGETLTVSGPGASQDLEIAGFLRDSQMNSSYASSKRLLVHEADLDSLTAVAGDAGSIEYLIEFRLTDAAAVGEFETEYRAAGLEANGPTITWSLFTLVNSLSEGITAAVVLLVTLLLVGIAVLCVRFTLLTAIERDYREIGVLKAIGIRARDLRTLYSRRYVTLALAGAVLGFAASFLLSRVLLSHVTLFMGPSGREVWAILAGVLASAVVVGIVWLAIRGTLRRIHSVSPVQAIRTGSAASRRNPAKPSALVSVIPERPGTNVRLGVRDVIRRAGTFVVPLVIYTLAAFIVVMPQNMRTTVLAPDFVTYMGAGESDLRIDVQQPAPPAEVAGDDAVAVAVAGEPTGTARLAEVGAALAADPEVTRHAVLSTASYTAPDASGAPSTVKIESGDLASFPIAYSEGAVPDTAGEISLSRLLADALGAVVGDTITVTPALAADGASGTLALTVSGIYQDITNGGQTAKMIAPHTSGDLMWSTLYADLAEGADVDAAIARYRALGTDLRVSSVTDYVQATLGGTVDALSLSAAVSFGIGIAVAALITALFMRMLIIRDSFSIAVMRAIGFRDGHIQTQYLVRSVVVLVAGVVLGAILANTLGGALASGLLSTIGLSDLRLLADPWLSYLISPLVLFAVVLLATRLSARPGLGRPISSTLSE